MQTDLNGNKVVIFRVGHEEYAVSIAAVKEVVPWTQPTPVPEAPPVVEGVVNLRGDVFPVIDLGKLFQTGRTKEATDARIIILEVEGQQAGFVVDDVTAVETIRPEAIAEPSSMLRQSSTAVKDPILSGILRMGENRLVILVDAARILSGTQLTAGV